MSAAGARFAVRGFVGQDGKGRGTVVRDLPPLLRRRITPLGKQVTAAAYALPVTGGARLIFSSRHGEFDRTLAILKTLADAEPVSPADFSLSVHHALVSLVAIAEKNTAGHTALAAGDESFCMGLVEAAACLHENPEQPVLLVHGDAQLPEAYAVFNAPDNQTSVLALWLEAPENTSAPVFSVEVSPRQDSDPCPCDSAAAFLAFLESDAATLDTFSARRRWHWERHGDA